MPDQDDSKSTSEEEQRQSTLNIAEQKNASVTIFRSWTLRLAGGFGLFSGILLFLFGSKNLSLIFLGLGVAGLSYGLAQNMRSGLRALGGLGIIIAGLGFLLIGLQSFQKTKASVNWPSAPASITKSTTEKRTAAKGNGNNQTVTQEKVLIEYSYSVGGATFASKQVSLGENNHSDTKRLLNQYPIHKQLRAYYNPEKPGEAVLEPGKSEGNFFSFAFGIILCLIGGFTAFGDFRKYLDELST
jgi:Protein of unknown function (DUF3592)